MLNGGLMRVGVNPHALTHAQRVAALRALEDDNQRGYPLPRPLPRPLAKRPLLVSYYSGRDGRLRNKEGAMAGACVR